MKRYYILTTIAIVLLACMQGIYAMSVYADYANRFHYNFGESCYISIDKEYMARSLTAENLDYKKGVRVYDIEDMPQEMLDSILKENPLPPPPPRYNIEQLRANGIIRHSSELSAQMIQDEYFDKGFGVDIAVLDSLFIEKFDIATDHCFVVMDTTGTITNRTSQTDLSLYQHHTKPYKIGTQARQTIIGYYNIPISSFIYQSIWSFVASLLMLGVVVMSLMVQIKIIRKKQVALNRINQNINGTIHDLKAPLAGLSMTLDVAKKTTSSEDLRRIFTLNQSNIKNLIATIDSLLSVARRNSLMHKQEISTDQLQTTIESIISDLNTLYAHKPHSITVENNLSPDLTLIADKLHIESILRNLMDNAIKYADTGVKVRLFLVNDDKTITIIVIDNGWGIPAKYHKKLRKEFFQVPRTENSERGYGVGLTHVYNIIRHHHGTIKLNSAEGHGTTFTVNIPLNHVE